MTKLARVIAFCSQIISNPPKRVLRVVSFCISAYRRAMIFALRLYHELDLRSIGHGHYVIRMQFLKNYVVRY